MKCQVLFSGGKKKKKEKNILKCLLLKFLPIMLCVNFKKDQLPDMTPDKQLSSIILNLLSAGNAKISYSDLIFH